jgi:hypothetical protein
MNENGARKNWFTGGGGRQVIFPCLPAGLAPVFARGRSAAAIK